MAAVVQLELPNFSEPLTYHNIDRSGFFSLLYQRLNGKKQHSYPVETMAQVLSTLDYTIDTWMSQAEFFKACRRLVHLRSLGLLFVDLDTHTLPNLRDKTPEGLTWALIEFCRLEGLPPPSLVLFSGRGLYGKWLLDSPLPRQALPRWNACQRELVARLSEFGADTGAKDASRVLRVVNTVNSKSGERVRVVHVNGTMENPLRYSFEWLCETLLPVSREVIEKQRKTKLRSVEGNKTSGLCSFSGRRLAWDRLEDLRKLFELRGGVSEGERMVTLFWQLNFLLLSGAAHSSQLWHEATALAREIDPNWSYRSPELSTLYQKAKAYNAGEMIEFNGKRYPALYTPKNDMLISLFRITDDEQKQLRTIISTNEAHKRAAEREEARRRANGVVPRNKYESQARKSELREQVRKLNSEGLSQRKLAVTVGVSQQRVSKLLKS